MADRPTNSGEARDLALDWAEGKRSWINIYNHLGPDVVATMDTQEVVKWTALAVMFAQMDVAAGRDGY